MSAPDIDFAEGDDLPVVPDTLEMPDGTPADLTGATVASVYKRRWDLAAVHVSETVDIVGDPTDGNIEWTPAAPMIAGDYDHNWEVTFAGGRKLSWPNRGVYWMKVRPAI